jgi:glycosyltransferase involved in cell wall biosynthesis
MKNINLAIVLGYSIFTGAGTEMVVLNYIKHKPELLNLTLIQSDLLLYNRKNLNENDLPQQSNFDIIEIKTKKEGQPLLNILSSYHNNKHLLERFNIVYFPIQFVALPFKKNKNQLFILGGHGTPVFTGYGKKLKFLIYTYMYKKINSYHQLYNGEALEYYYEGNTFTVPNGIDTNVFYPLKGKVNQDKFLFVGRLEEGKGIKILVESWKKAGKYTSASLTIVGNGPLKSYVENNLKYNIIYKCNIPILELANIYRNSDYFIEPSMSDNFPMVTLEALSSGLYVIGSALLKKIYSNYQNNLNLEFLNAGIDEFSEKIKELVDKPPTWDREKQYEIINQNFSWEKIAKKFYDEIIGVFNKTFL